jgi:hypothetical protein
MAVREERPLTELLTELSREVKEFVREEVELAKAEISLKMMHTAKDVVFLASGGMLLYTGLIALIAALILGLGTGMPWWLAALIVGAVIFGTGTAFAIKGLRDLRHLELKPTRTIQSLEEAARAAKEEAIWRKE